MPLFLGEDQLFIPGNKLKRDMQAFDAHFSALPANQPEQGLFRFATTPPNDDLFLTTRIYRKFGFPVDEGLSLTPKQNQKVGADIRAMIGGMEREARNPTSTVTRQEAEDARNITIQRMVPFHWGKWRVMPPGVKAPAG
jgi:hypothetical protein